MDRSQRIRQRDRRVSTVRRVTIWVSAGSLALAAGIGAILGIGQAGTAGTESGPTSTSTTNTTSGTTDSGGGFQKPSQAPGSSDGSGSVTSGGS